jgi:hypothetical protein
MKNVLAACLLFILSIGFSNSLFAFSESKKFDLSKQFSDKTSHFDSLWKQASDYQKSATKKSKGTFIIGGRQASNSEFPSVVALVEESGRSFCTGNLIAPDLIATAGHCALNLFQKDSADFKSLTQKVGQLSDAIDIEQLAQTIEQVVDANKKTIHVRIQGKNYFNIVASVAVSRTWTEWNADVAQYYINGKRDIRHNSNSVSDKAIIKLNRSFDSIELFPVINSLELSLIKQQRYKKAVQVGYGYIKDPTLIEQAANDEEQAKQQLLDLMDKKYMVELPVNTFFTVSEGIRVGIGKPGKAACYGDSGGPTFVQLLNGDWRYLASLSKSVSNRGLCGQNDANAWKESASEQKKQTTDIADVGVL